MAADRSGLAQRQARLLRSLIRGEGFPEGFAAEQAAAASLALRRKRRHAVAAAWPALAHTLGEEFEPRFDAFARRVCAPADGEGLADGLAFARCGLDGVRLTDAARVEVLFARARCGRVFLGAVSLRTPRRLLVVWRVPRAAVRQVVVRLG